LPVNTEPKSSMWNLPNILTLLRIALIPVFIVVYYLPWEWHHFASAAIFGLAALTDWVDGYLARRFNQVTPFGAFLDPVADKLIVVAALVLLLEVHSTPLPLVPFSIRWLTSSLWLLLWYCCWRFTPPLGLHCRQS